jgi:ABC-type transport system substrate-binding protein
METDLRRRTVLGGAGALALGAAEGALAQTSPSTAPTASPSSGARVLRVCVINRDNGFDPAQVSDVISAALANSLFDSPLTYDPMARPAVLRLNTAAEMPKADHDFRHWVFRIKPGILFTPHAAFGGKPRELVAADYVYSVKRHYDPATRSPTLFHYESAGLLGLSELRKKAIDEKTPFDYDAPVAGIRALDRYTFELRTSRPAPRLPYVFATGALSGALAREVVQAEGLRKIAEVPIGTGAFTLGAWIRGARIVLEKNPRHTHEIYDAQANANDAEGLAAAAKLKGRTLPLADRVEIAIIEEAQPRWLSFLNGQLDLALVPPEFAPVAAPNGAIAPNLAKQGVKLQRVVIPTTFYVYFAMENPVLGGYTPERVALRRALALAYDSQREIDLARFGQAVQPQSILPPGVSGYDPKLKSVMSDANLPRAKALLDLYGYVDRNGDGWREQPGGQPLVLEFSTEPSQFSRRIQGLWQKSINALGIRVEARVASWQENIKASRAGKLMMWTTGWSAATPDGSYFLETLYSKNKGQSNHSRFSLPEVDALHEQQRAMPDGPERFALMQKALRLSLAYMPSKATAHTIENWVTYPRVTGYKQHPFIRDYWRYTDIEPQAAG